MQFKQILAFGMIVASATVAATASASEPANLGQRYASTCASCHGTNGVPLGGVVPGLAGQPKDYIVSAMAEFKQGKRQATIMHQIAKGYSDQQIELLAAYFAAQKK